MKKGYRFGLVGRGIGYSLSPQLHQAIGTSLGIKVHYELIDIPTLADVSTLWDRFQGLNVTTPYKEAMLDYCDEADPATLKIGACNTVVIRDGWKTAYNTDWIGFIRLLEETGLDFTLPLQALIIGSGGGARAVYYALKTKTKFHVTVANRTVERAKRLTHQVMTLHEAEEKLSNFDLVVNATTVGVKTYASPIAIHSVKPNSVYIDLNYQKNLKFLDDSQALGARTLNGWRMLVEQAFESFRLWTDLDLNINPMGLIIE